MPIADINQRFMSAFIDTILIIIFTVLMKHFLLDAIIPTTISLNICLISLMIIYAIIFESPILKGQTIGQKMLSIRIVNDDDSKSLSWLPAIKRILIFYFIPNLLSVFFTADVLKQNLPLPIYIIIFLPMHLIVLYITIHILISKRRQGLHDIFGKTIVICEHEEAKIIKQEDVKNYYVWAITLLFLAAFLILLSFKKMF